ncbi:MAG: TIGR04282 family arsenosugar biosynthesis glycosyltransferase [Mariprofundaceae bacterium]
MCKAPVEGKVKTRLMTSYSAKQAMLLHCAMATTVILRAKRLFKSITLAVDDVSHAFFKPFELPLKSQGEGDLGMRMQALGAAMDMQKLMFIGTDSPHMLDSRLTDAVQALQDVDVCLGAVEDGGYDLIGMKLHQPLLFSHIDWGTEKVLQQTLHIIAKQQLSHQVLAESFDVDTPDMLVRAQQAGWNINLQALHMEKYLGTENSNV